MSLERQEGHVAVEAVQLSKKRKRTITKKPLGKLMPPLHAVTATSAVASGHLRHICEHYRIETGVKTRIPLAHETIDAPLVNPAANKGDPIEKGYTPICWEFLNYGLRLPASSFVNSVLTAIDCTPSQLGPFSWATLTTFQVGCLSMGVVPSLNLFLRIFNVAHTGVLLHFHTRSQARYMLYHGKPGKASPSLWHKYRFLAKDAFSDEVHSSFSIVHTMLVYEESPELDEGLKKLEEGFLKPSCWTSSATRMSLSKLGYRRALATSLILTQVYLLIFRVCNFLVCSSATLLRAKDGKYVVPNQVSYLEVISGN
ncbi:hypothetical protein LIER_06763 [Lithospermum erythrorhizon]|uniref:Transposase (putative) gypsy type domain-containing protein n=1 Tax=Lithospermum erythrorhizon TaxID=34254 RepID=A0AAV3P7J2_LITER